MSGLCIPEEVLLYGLNATAGMNLSKKSPPESECFRSAVGAVRPLKTDDRYRELKPKPVPRKTRSTPLAVSENADVNPAEPATQARVAEACQAGRAMLREGLSRKRLRRLGSHECPVEDAFDLHGMTERAASRALSRFLTESLAEGLECIRIVHGKGLRSGGLPILKLMSWQQLWRHPSVLALKPCSPADGGTGAILVLLRTNGEFR